MRQTVGENSFSQEHLKSGGFPDETGGNGRDKTGSDQGVGAHKDSGFVTLFLQDVIDGVETTSFHLPGTEGADKLFALEAPGHLYTRVSNPTQDAFEQRLAEIEGGAAALALDSGRAASAYAVLNLARAGDNIVSASRLPQRDWPGNMGITHAGGRGDRAEGYRDICRCRPGLACADRAGRYH